MNVIMDVNEFTCKGEIKEAVCSFNTPFPLLLPINNI